MPNWKLIAKIMGFLLFIEAGLMAVCQGVSWAYGEGAHCFLPAIGTACALGVAGVWAGRGAGRKMGRKDGYIIVSSVWLVFTLVGMLPFLFDGHLSDPAGAFFESMSGFTSTGATVIDDLDAFPNGLLFWRSLSQWIGGIGIVFFTIAILPAFGAGEVKLFAAESTGPMHDKVHPRISVAVKWIGSVYMVLTLLCIGALCLCGMPFFDAVNYGLCTTATGGYGTHSEMLEDLYHSPAVEYTLIFFMFVSGINYTLIYYTILKGKIQQFFRDSELRTYLVVALGLSLVCAAALFARQPEIGVEYSLRQSLFTIISLQTTTGLATTDYTLWPTVLMPILLFVMWVGACSGSTSGGVKCVRLTIAREVLKNEIQHILHPRAVIPVRMDGRIVPYNVVKTLLGFTVLFICLLFIGAFALTICGVSANGAHEGMDYYEAFSLALSSISNVGPSLGYYGPAHSWAILSPASKYVCALLMLVGRLEIFPIIILFSRSFWQKN